jgi:aminopeptidase N
LKKITFLLVSMLISFTAFAQLPKLNMKDIRAKMVEQKQKNFELMKMVESERTSNQEKYDIKYYSLELTPDPTTSILTGNVQIVGEIITTSLGHIELNFIDNMEITDIYLTDTPEIKLTYNRSNHILSVNLGSDYSQGQLFDFSVEYHGTPWYGFGFDSHRGQPMIWSLSQPYGARAWWPCKDLTSDKADSIDMRVTVPAGLIVASNGSLVEQSTSGGKTTFWWHEKYPIIPYLVSVAIHPYAVEYDDYIYNDGADTMKIHFYMFPDHVNELTEINPKVKEMIAFFSEIYGLYPFADEKYGHADYYGGGAMEHQTCSSFSFWNEWVYAHELSHQWWGDMVTCDSWHHIWLNEGFATYSEALWTEYTYRDIYPEGIASAYQMQESLYLGPGTVYVEDPLTEPILHGGLSYNKGSWVLHMLRHVVGENNFFDILKAYYNSVHKYGTATTEQFQAICEQVSGMDLEYYFFQWIYGPGYPIYDYGWTSELQGDGSYKVKGFIDQIQTDYPLFKMPLDISIVSYDTVITTYTQVIENQSHSFEYTSAEEPWMVLLDIGNWVLKEVNEKTEPEIVFSSFSVNDPNGNNDGKWDEGETINLYVEVTNLGIDAENISITLQCPHTAVTIQNSTVEFGDVKHSVAVSNNTQPFVLSLSDNVPGTISPIILTITGSNDYSTMDRFYIEMGSPHILLVDDDNGANYEEYYKPILISSLIYAQQWENQLTGLPTDTLENFDTIIWFTGDDRTTTITLAEQTLLKNFLDKGGKLLLSGQNIGYDLIENGTFEDSLFYTNYLKAEYINDKAEPVMLLGNPNDSQMQGIFLNFDGAYGGASNQDSPDIIKEIEPAAPMLKYLPSQETAGLRYINEAAGSFLIYLPFGFEGVAGPYENSAVEFLNKCMTWLSGTTDVRKEISQNNVPKEYSLEQNYPNPFNPTTAINYKLPEKTEVSLNIYNLLGQKIITLVQDVQPAGSFHITWDGRDDYGLQVAGGVYFYQLKTNNYSETKKMVLVY